MEIGALSGLALASLIGLATAQPTSHVSSYELPAIAGTWEIELNEGATCKEMYNFGKDGRLTTTSGAEHTFGEYRFMYLENNEAVKYPVLAMITDYDNNQTDCSGNQVDQAGHSLAVFVKLNARHNPTKMQWCEDEEGQVCTATLHKLLP